jgi:hypothetical protein
MIVPLFRDIRPWWQRFSPASSRPFVSLCRCGVEGTIAELKKQVAALTATVKEQAAQIQKVSGQLEASKPAPQVVLNNQ